MGERAWRQHHVFSITSNFFSLFPDESINFPPLAPPLAGNIANEQYQRKLMFSGDIELYPGPVFL